MPVVVSNCLLGFEGYWLPHPCLQAKLRPYHYLLSFLFFYSTSPLTHQLPLLLSLLSLSLFFSVSHSLHPLRAAGSGRSLLRRSQLITCILDRRATWGHTLPEDRSIHAGGNIGMGAGGLRPGARSKVGVENLKWSRSRGEVGWMLGWQLQEPEGQGRRKGMQRGVRGRAIEPGQEERVSVSDRSLRGLSEALLRHGRAELTGERTAPPLMMPVKVPVGVHSTVRWTWWAGRGKRWKKVKWELDTVENDTL